MICCDVRVFVTVGRLLAVLVLAGIVVVVGQLPAQACSCVSASTAAHAKDANAVFTGTVTDVASEQKADGQRGATMTYDVQVDRVYKGAVSSSTVQVTSERSGSSCGLGQLPADRRYAFFTKASGSELSATSCGGTARASAKLVAEIENVLGSGHDPVPPEPDKAVFTQVGPGAPTSVTRLAAPGAALVLVGLLGLLVVRRVGSRG